VLLGTRLGDRVKVWATQNEPQCFIGVGHVDGIHAPGDKLPLGEYLVAAHNSMRAHAKAVQALRATVKGAQVGYAIAVSLKQPASASPDDIEAARAATFAVGRSPWNNAWWTEPVLRGTYPEDGLATYGAQMPRLKASDLDEMKQPLDYLGLNIYKAEYVRRGANGESEELPTPPGYPRSGVDWQPITPACMYWGPRYFHERYRLPIAITESGLSTRDQVFLDGKVHDPQRIDYMHRVLLELSRAIQQGVPVTSYYVWSLLDNFEWAEGYKQRFGLVYVDFQNQKRVPKDSFDWYRQVIATNGKALLDKGRMPVTQVTP
jgi:beta-glucosidase